MGHRLNAVVVRGERPATLPLHRLLGIALEKSFLLIPLSAALVDHLAEIHGCPGFLSDRPLLNARVVHRLVHELFADNPFAIIETDYHGGHGDQAAAAYAGDLVLLEPTEGGDAVNAALMRIGVKARGKGDAFATLGLGRFRDSDELVAQYFREA